MSEIIKINRTAGFTTVLNNPFQRVDISWKAKGLLIYLLSCSEDWKIFKKDLKNRSTDGYDSTMTAFKELEELGYIETIVVKHGGGLFDTYEYLVHESPSVDFPDSGEPDSDNPRLISNSLNKNIKKSVFKVSLSKQERAAEFKKRIVPFFKSSKNPDGYEADFLKQFYDHWVETDDSTKKLRFEEQKFFDVGKRLRTFYNISKPKTGFKQKVEQDDYVINQSCDN